MDTALLEAAGAALAAMHFGVPLAYYLYLRRAWLHRPWRLRRDPGYTPRVSIIIPTYMGARHIAKRLDKLVLELVREEFEPDAEGLTYMPVAPTTTWPCRSQRPR